MNRTDVVAAMAERTSSSKAEADAALTALSDILIEAVGKGEKVQIPGVLTVERSERAARTGRNPQTGETMEIPAGYSAKVTAGSKLKSAAKGA